VRGSWLLLGVAGLAFWIGGRAISEFAKVDRILAEFLGLSRAGVTGVAGYLLKTRADDLDGYCRGRHGKVRRAL
jgi:hypothetical protein